MIAEEEVEVPQSCLRVLSFLVIVVMFVLEGLAGVDHEDENEGPLAEVLAEFGFAHDGFHHGIRIVSA